MDLFDFEKIETPHPWEFPGVRSAAAAVLALIIVCGVLRAALAL